METSSSNNNIACYRGALKRGTLSTVVFDNLLLINCPTAAITSEQVLRIDMYVYIFYSCIEMTRF